MTISRLKNLATISCIRILRRAIKERATIAQIQHDDSWYDGDRVNGRAVVTRIFFVPLVSLLLFAICPRGDRAMPIDVAILFRPYHQALWSKEGGRCGAKSLQSVGPNGEDRIQTAVGCSD